MPVKTARPPQSQICFKILDLGAHIAAMETPIIAPDAEPNSEPHPRNCSEGAIMTQAVIDPIVTPVASIAYWRTIMGAADIRGTMHKPWKAANPVNESTFNGKVLPSYGML